MARVIFTAIALFVGICFVSAKKKGPPLAACKSMTPSHAGVKPGAKKPYHVIPACYVFEENEIMQMRLKNVRLGGGPYKGMFMQVRKEENIKKTDTVGEFIVNDQPGESQNPADNFQPMKCFGIDNSAVSHKNPSLKIAESTFVTWKGPATCKQNEIFYIRATVVKLFHEFQTDIVVPIICNANRSDVDVMEKIRPIHHALYCSTPPRGSWAIIPEYSSESFESETLPMGGWSHMFSDPAHQFKRIMGPTPTEGTGASEAQDGDYYLYFEASGTRKFDSAGLVSPHGLVGCFCLSLWCHMDTDKRTQFRISVLGDEPRTLSDIVLVNPKWSRVTFDFQQVTPATIVIQVFSSGGEKGDIGIDNLRIQPGKCS
ncbi:uncharacterized protein LOC120331080 [Styela clava]|uniref:uncharacterized protein LOC120331080 n=1 Tax=Styela clava TaxID=7725 RepID=UPI00193AA15C|nr:uncharacterized protein LOC120331080 [Styela clava]